MADPFEVRMRFTNLLTHLSASTTSSLKTAAFALKHRDMDEDLHSCIIENLERPGGGSIHPASTTTAANITLPSSTTNTTTTFGPTTSTNPHIQNATDTTDLKPTREASSAALMNNRANIMYFLEHFCEMAIREKHEAYVEFVRRDMHKIVDSVAASGANVKVVRRVVGTLGEKGVLSGDEVKRVEENLKEKEKERGLMLLDDGDEGGIGGERTGGGEDVEMAYSGTVGGVGGGEDRVESGGGVPGAVGSKKSLSENLNRNAPRSGRDGKPNGVSKADKRAIEQRIEEDRERNKRLREGVWAVSGDDENELDKMWEEGSDLSEDDYVIGQEEADERRQFARYHQSLLQR